LLKDGRLIKNLVELTQMLTDMDDETFNHHVNDAKNDFYEWIKHSIDADFSEQIKFEKNKSGLKNKIQEYINSKKK